MKSWSTLVLALISLALLAYFYFGGKDMPSTTERQEAARRLIAFESDKVTRLELSNSNGEFLLLKEASGAWRLEKPLATEADSSPVNQILSDLEFARRKSTLKPSDFQDYAKALESFGLKSPRATVKLQENGQAWSLALGNETAVGAQLYALASDGKKEDLVVVDKSLEDSLVLGLDRLRSRAVFTFQTPFVESLTLRRGEQAVEVAKSGDSWKIVRPLESPADESQVSGLLASMLGVRVVDFVTEAGADAGAYGLNAPSAVLEVKTSSGLQTLRIGQPVPGKELVHVQRAEQGGVVTLPKAMVDRMTGLLEEVRDRRLAAFQDTFAFSSWRIERRGSVLVEGAAGAGRTWKVGGTPGHEANAELVNAFLLGLRDQKGEAPQPKTEDAVKRAGLTTPQAVVTLVPSAAAGAEAPAQPLVIRFGPTRKGKIAVDSSRLPYLLEVPEAVLGLFPASGVDWHSTTVRLVASAGDIQRLAWKRPAGETVLARGEDGTWKHANGQAADAAAVERLMQVLQTTEATAWLPVREADFAQPRVTLEISGKDGLQRTLDLVLHGKDADNRVRIRGEASAFIVPAQTAQILDTPPAAAPPPQQP